MLLPEFTAPVAVVSPVTKSALVHQLNRKLCREIGYICAGTVEFLVDLDTQEFLTVHYRYDDAGRLIGVDLPGGDSIDHTLDAAGNRTISVISHYTDATRTFDEVNRLETYTDQFGNEDTDTASESDGYRGVNVDVEIVARDGLIVATIADDGVGFDPASLARSPFPRFGLTIMHERAESVGGALEVDSAPEKGTRVRIEVPQGGRA